MNKIKNAKKVKNVVAILSILIILISISTKSLAHGGNITGWKDKNSKYILEHDGKYYGYHKQNGVIHYHQVKWNEDDKKWVIIAPAVYYDENFSKIENNNEESANKTQVKLISVVDGDTAKFTLNKDTVTVRFLGINTKETVHPEIGEEAYGKDASNFTKEKLENATKIEMEFDSSADEKDKYGRYLAWIWIDDVLLQNLLVEKGLAETYMLQNNYKYAGLLQESEETAKNNKLGIWSNENNEDNDSVNTVNKTTITENIKTNKNAYIVLEIITILLFITVFIITHKNRKSK